MSKSKRERREKFGLGEKITYGRPAPSMPQGPNNQDLNPKNFDSMPFSQASMNGMTQNPFMDAQAFVPQLGAPGGKNIATFSGNNQNNVPGTKLNGMPPNMQPAFPQQGSAPDADRYEAARINQQIIASGLYGGPMGLGNPGQMPAPGSVPGQMPQQTQNTIPPQGIAGGLAQGNQPRGGRSKKGGLRT